MLTLVTTLLACTAAPDGPTGSSAETRDSGGGDPGGDGGGIEAPVPAPEWTAQQAADAADAALVDGLPSPVLLREAWRALIDAGQDGVCPGPAEMADADLTGCTSEHGYTYMGLAFVEDRGASGTDQDWLFTGDFEIREPGGGAYQAGGHASHGRFHEGGGRRFFWGDVQGSWQQDGAEGWLGAGTSALFGIEGTLDLSAVEVQIDGSVTVQGVSLDFDRVHLDDSRCEGHPEGVVSIRDPSGGWYELDFACDGCAPATFAGEAVGEACLDLRPAISALAEELGE